MYNKKTDNLCKRHQINEKGAFTPYNKFTFSIKRSFQTRMFSYYA
jgi:hypothetical protein